MVYCCGDGGASPLFKMTPTMFLEQYMLNRSTILQTIFWIIFWGTALAVVFYLK